MPSIKAESCWGICSTPMAQANTAEMEVMTKRLAVVFPADQRESRIIFTVMFLKTKAPTIRA